MALISIVSVTAAYLHSKIYRRNSVQTSETPALPDGADNWLQELPVRTGTEYDNRLLILFHVYNTRYVGTLENTVGELDDDISQLISFLRPDHVKLIRRRVPGSWSSHPVNAIKVEWKKTPDLFKHVRGTTLVAVFLTEAQELVNWKCLSKGLDMVAMLKWVREASIGQYFPAPQLSIALPYMPSHAAPKTLKVPTSPVPNHSRSKSMGVSKTWASSTDLDQEGDTFYTSMLTLRYHRKLQVSEFLLRLDSLVAVLRFLDDRSGKSEEDCLQQQKRRSEITNLLTMKERIQKMIRQGRLRSASDPQSADDKPAEPTSPEWIRVPPLTKMAATLSAGQSLPGLDIRHGRVADAPESATTPATEASNSSIPSTDSNATPTTITDSSFEDLSPDLPAFPTLPQPSSPYFTAVHTLIHLYTSLVSPSLGLPPVILQTFLQEEQLNITGWFRERFGKEDRAVADDEGDKIVKGAPSEWVRGWLER